MIPLEDIYNKGVNLLLGSGASFGLFPTLQLGITNESGKSWTLEELATVFELTEDQRYIPLFMHYYTQCILPAQRFSIPSTTDNTGKTVIENYRLFLQTLLALVQRRQSLDKRCNVFTTNYDGCIPLVADDLINSGTHDFLINDGTRGFRTKILEARNFNSYLCHSGVFDRHSSSIPQINLIHLHGSVYWKKSRGRIEVDYNTQQTPLLDSVATEKLSAFSNVLGNPKKSVSDLPMPEFSKPELEKFKAAYDQIPIVNPTKWKFHETVYDEHYYQMLRMLSYELEKPNAVLITFGFSFADEHILNLVKRSLSNPRLQVYVCCYDAASHSRMLEHFCQHPNVTCLTLQEGIPMSFTEFNNQVFRIKQSSIDSEKTSSAEKTEDTDNDFLKAK
ncbi:hypothetical protein [Azohydromonas aeria]|uniref:hypothetical protein n=1 Tax=Azohydromonas aeria TaxID=2590212 RepID=UPI0012FCAFDF|nr:hypothetical protein [Azohydromonas aeria]